MQIRCSLSLSLSTAMLIDTNYSKASSPDRGVLRVVSFTLRPSSSLWWGWDGFVTCLVGRDLSISQLYAAGVSLLQRCIQVQANADRHDSRSSVARYFSRISRHQEFGSTVPLRHAMSTNFLHDILSHLILHICGTMLD